MRLYDATLQAAGLIEVDSMRLWTDNRDTLVLPTYCEQVVFKADPIEPRWWYVVQVAPCSRLVYEDLANTEIEDVVPSAQNNLLRDGEDSEEDEQQESRVLTAVVEEVEGTQKAMIMILMMTQRRM